MGFIKKLFGRLFADRKKEYRAEDAQKEQSGILSRDSVDLYDQRQRMRYVQSCLEQMKDAEMEIENLTKEYSMVTSYLTDMEELEALPDMERKELSAIADKIAVYESEKNLFEKGKNRMPEREFRRMERMEEEVEEGIAKLQETENYQEKVRQDLGRLDNERHAYQYRKHDLQATMVNMRGMIIITGFAFVTCMAILLLLQNLMRMDIGIGYILAASATALTIFLTYLKYTEAAKEKKQVERDINRLILLHNRVKIRYVNNTNLLEYLHVKYQVASADELARLWKWYEAEKEEREKFKRLHADLDYHRKEMLKILRRFRIKDPEMWLNQPEAISNRGEMVEIRHGLIQRRQNLRKQMDYNEKLAESAQTEVKALVEEFPLYAPEILEMVSKYEQNAAS